MCGIIGYVGKRPCKELLLEGLEKLEYRGYDSAGLSVLVDGHFDSVRAVGNLSKLRAAISENGASGAEWVKAKTGIGHTRWATHGKPSVENAHPHFGCEEEVQVVVNGIIENHQALRAKLEDNGCVFSSETDAEVVAHLLEKCIKNEGLGLADAVRETYRQLVGHFALVAAHSKEPDLIVGARRECPLVVGVGDGETFIASAIPAFLKQTDQIQVLEDEEVVEASPHGAVFTTPEGDQVQRELEEVDWDEDAAEKSGFPTFMLKEIHEQPYALAETLGERLDRPDGVDLGDIGICDDELKELKRIILIACGTSYHAAVVGRYAIEQWVRLPVEMDIASEYRYRNPVVGPGDLVVGITQSGETADTLAAMRMARERGAKVLAVTNVVGTQATREADGVLFSRAGLEIGVAATKTFVAQVGIMYLLALRLAELRGTLHRSIIRRLVADLKGMPQQMGRIITETDRKALEVAKKHYQQDFFLYLGRNVGLPIALEGALKLKEISYIPTEAYAAGEMKHGPIALLGEDTPVVCVATESPVQEKVLSNIAEVKARGATVIAVATEEDPLIEDEADDVFFVPRSDWLLQPLLAVLPLQLLAYHIAILKGLNVDQPRNLAKTVTVE